MTQKVLASILLLALITYSVACGGNNAGESISPTSAAPTSAAVSPAPTAPPISDTFVTVATTAPYAPFEFFDDFGTVIGFDADLLTNIMGSLGREHEFVVTNYDGMLASVAGGEFDMAISPMLSGEPTEGILYTEPYLEVAQVLVVLANEPAIQSPSDLVPGMMVGVVTNSFGQKAALETLGVPESDLVFYETVGSALQGLIDGNVRGVIIDQDDAIQFTETYFQQLKIAGGSGPDSRLSSREYRIAVNAENEALLAELNAAITELIANDTVGRLTRNWLVSNETLDAGESLVGTPSDVLVIGIVGQVDSVDPAAGPSLIGWELKRNVMSGLVMYDTTGSLVPVLAAALPEISVDRLEYTFDLRTDLTFPDGAPLTAEDVKWSIDRAAAGGNWHINAFLKDSDENSIADSDAVVVVAPNRVRVTVKEPTSYFLSILATPAYYVANQDCYAVNEEPGRTCSGIGPYEIVEWESGDRVQLKTNPRLPVTFLQPAIENVQLRFYSDSATMRSALDLEAIDMAWTGVTESHVRELAAIPGVVVSRGPITFKSYIVFEQSEPPWDNPTIRQAAALAIDHDALAQVFGGERQPLFSPVPTDVPGYVAVLPQRDLEQARSLMAFVGYTEANPLEITLWYLNDGRYTPLESAYAEAIKSQLEEAGVFRVTLESAPWETYSQQMSACEYPAFLLGWPPVGWPSRYPAAMGWLDYFVTNTDSLCSNYASEQMDLLISELRGLDPLDTAGQLTKYAEIQTLWAQEYPTLDLTTATRAAISWDNIDHVRFDNMGLLLYQYLTKTAADVPLDPVAP